MGREDLLRLSFGDRFNALRDIEFRGVRANIRSALFGNVKWCEVGQDFGQLFTNYETISWLWNFFKLPYLPFKKKSLWFIHHQTRYPFVTQNTLINETQKVTLWNSNWFIQTEFPQLMESIVTRKYNVSPREIASYENSFEEFVPRSIEENCRLREEDWPRISKKTLRYRSVYTRRERGEDWKGRGEDRVEWYCGDERVYSWRSFGVGGRSVRYSHNSTYE